MKTSARLVVLCVFALASYRGVGALAAQSKGDAPEPKFVTIGTVEKVDPKGKFITLVHAFSVNVEQFLAASGNSPSALQRGGSRGGRGGGGRGGGRRGGGEGDSGSSSPGPSPLGGPTTQALQAEYKVSIAQKTILKEGPKPLRWMDLKPGDRVQVMSMKTGAAFDALEIDRVPEEDSRETP